MKTRDTAHNESERLDLYRELFERSADASLIIEGDTFVDCNQSAVEMLRYETRDQVLRTHPSELSPPTQPDGQDSFETANEMMALALEKGSHRFEWSHRRADGEVFPVEVLLTVVRRGERPLLHVVWRDLTEQKQLERHLRQTQKMEALGRLSGGIAHDFNNLLVAILGNADLLAMRLDEHPELMGHVDDIQRASERAAALVRQLMSFSREQKVSPRVIDLNDVTAELHRLLVRLIGADVRLVTIPCEQPVWVKGDPIQFERMLLNLATNARDAMPAGGTLTIELRRVEVSESTGDADGLESGSYALLSVSDTGSGMDEETAAHAFDPFFTTKAQGEGTGLGLSTVYGIARSSGGVARVDTAPGDGTTIRVYLPLSSGGDSRSGPRVGLPTAGGDETIFVTEDDPAVSSLVVRVLRSKGYRVLLAEDGAEALSMWRRCGDEVDLLLTDVVMPNLGGAELVARLREMGHVPRVLFASGYTNNALAKIRALGEGVDLLEKPFSAAELVGRVRLALDKPPPSRR